MSEKGYIKLDRQLMDHALWQEKPFDRARAWVDLLMLANYKDHDVIYKGKLEHRKRGEVNTTIGYLALRWGWSENKVRRFIRHLNGSQMVHTNGSTHPVFLPGEFHGQRSLAGYRGRKGQDMTITSHLFLPKCHGYNSHKMV